METMRDWNILGHIEYIFDSVSSSWLSREYFKKENLMNDTNYIFYKETILFSEPHSRSP